MSNNSIRHGEAVAVGIAIDLRCTEEMGLVQKQEVDTVFEAMESTGLKLRHEMLFRADKKSKFELQAGLE